MSTIWVFDHIENKHTLYRGKDCMKKFCESLREHAKNIIDFEKKKMLPLTKEELKSRHDAKLCYICGKMFLKKLANDKNYRVRNHCNFTGKYRGAAHSICNFKFNVSNEIPAVFYNGSNYDYNFIIKELANEFGRQLECLGENTENYKTISVPIEKQVIKVDKEGIENIITISYKIKFIDSARFIASLLSNLVDNLAEEIHKIKCEDCGCFLEYESVKDNLIKYKCLSCNKNYSNKIDEELNKRFKNTFKFSNNDINKLILLLRKGVYPHEYRGDWEKCDETVLTEKKDIYSSLNMEDIADADYIHAKRVCKDFEIKNLGEYYDLYIKSDTLLLASVFEKFRKMCLKTLSFRFCKISFSSWISMASSFKKDRNKIRIVN